MAVIKHSRQRDCIKEFLMHRYDHPTADTVYAHVREEFPNISLGTVYRNLSLLSELGEIRKITCDGPDRFDGNTTPHFHFTCRHCGSVSDIHFESPIRPEEIHPTGFTGMIEQVHVEFSGLCEECIKKS